jgi:N-acetylmuramoyl-L-alanine amidase-like protein
MLSPLAKIPSQQFTTGQIRPGPPWGVAFHTTGSELPTTAKGLLLDPLLYGVQEYMTIKGPTYLIGWDGTIAATAQDENIRTWHIGVEANELQPLLTGAWRQLVSPATAAAWDRKHGAGKNPISADGTTAKALIPGTDPNNLLVGVEMIPVTPDGKTYWADPMRPGLRFTRAQHDAAARLAQDLASRYGWPSGWQNTRVFGHEDINPLRRSDSGGGWDPGDLRADPYIDFAYIRGGSWWPLLLVGAGIAALLAFRRL